MGFVAFPLIIEYIVILSEYSLREFSCRKLVYQSWICQPYQVRYTMFIFKEKTPLTFMVISERKKLWGVFVFSLNIVNFELIFHQK